MPGSSHGDFSLPSGPNMHASASSSQRKHSWQSHRMSSIRSGRSHASRLSNSSANQPGLVQEELRHASTATSAQSSQPKWWRVRLFRGMINDVKRRAPYYWSDWTDAWDYRIVPATVYMYFAKYDSPLASFTYSSPVLLPVYHLALCNFCVYFSGT